MLCSGTKKGKRWGQWGGGSAQGVTGRRTQLVLYVAWLLISFHHWITSRCIMFYNVFIQLTIEGIPAYSLGQLWIKFCKIHVQACMWTSVFRSVGLIPSSTTAGAWGKRMSGFIRDCPTGFQSNALHPHQQEREFLLLCVLTSNWCLPLCFGFYPF